MTYEGYLSSPPIPHKPSGPPVPQHPEITYEEFLASKRVLAPTVGFNVPRTDLNSSLFDWQADIVQWALEKGKAALLKATGTGKTLEELAWSDQVCRKADGDVLVAAPLCVSLQTQREGVKFGIPATVCRTQSDVKPGINITNYEMLEHFDPSHFKGIVLDESSRLKDRQSKTSVNLIERFARTPYKLCASATPAPNDYAELGSHAEFLDVMTKAQMLAMFFEHDGGNTAKWELKGHARKPFWHWMASWAVCLNTPSDLWYPNDDFILPPLNMQEHIVKVDQSIATEGMLFRCPDMSSTGIHKELRLTAHDRAMKVVELVKSKPHEQWLIWTNTNHEADVLKKLMPEVLEVRGSDKIEKKEQAILGFLDGNVQHLLSKPSIFGLGLNLQCCHNMVFYGMGYSFELVWQAIRRCWRFGQKYPVDAHIVIAETEGPVMEAQRRKQKQFEELQNGMVEAMRSEQLQARRTETNYDHGQRVIVPDWLVSESEAA